jgi:hypothetical protein
VFNAASTLYHDRPTFLTCQRSEPAANVNATIAESDEGVKRPPLRSKAAANYVLRIEKDIFNH